MDRIVLAWDEAEGGAGERADSRAEADPARRAADGARCVGGAVGEGHPAGVFARRGIGYFDDAYSRSGGTVGGADRDHERRAADRGGDDGAVAVEFGPGGGIAGGYFPAVDKGRVAAVDDRSRERLSQRVS